ncbi:hypothetical protein ACWD4V_18315 [Streptomyces tsukubensis]
MVAPHELDAVGASLYESQPEDLGAALGRELKEIVGLEVFGKGIDRYGGERTT